MAKRKQIDYAEIERLRTERGRKWIPITFPRLSPEQQQQLIARLLAGPHDDISIDPGVGSGRISAR